MLSSQRCLAVFTLLLAALCGVPAAAQAPPPGVYSRGELLANLDAPFLDEVSGIAASRRNKNIYWVHNDSGDGPFLYAVNRKGKIKGVYQVGSAAIDWEDIAYGPGPKSKGNYLYIGDIGDNNLRRASYTIYRVPEPKINDGATGSKDAPLPTPIPTVTITFTYPDGPHNAEALLVHPRTGVVYVVTKEKNGIAGVYRFPPPEAGRSESRPITPAKVGEIRIAKEFHPYPNLVTGGDIAPDGRRVVLRTYVALYEWKLPDGATDFDDIWKTPPTVIRSPGMAQSEAVCYSADGKSLLTTSEKRPAPLYELKRSDTNP